MKYMRYCIITAFLCAIALSCLAESTVAERTDTKGYCVFGAWMLVSETAPDGKETSSIYTQYTRCKIYDADSTYYTVQLHAVGEDMMILAHEMGHYHLNDSIYIENGREMPFEWVNDSTLVPSAPCAAASTRRCLAKKAAVRTGTSLSFHYKAVTSGLQIVCQPVFLFHSAIANYLPTPKFDECQEKFVTLQQKT